MFPHLSPTDFMSSLNPSPAAHEHSRSNWTLVVLTVVCVVLATLQIRSCWVQHNASADAPRKVSPRGDLGADEKATIQLFEETSPSVVYITNIDLRRDAFTRNINQIPQGTGSGFIWDQAGHVVTNYHVIQGADRAIVTLFDQSTWEATLVGAEPDKDLAVLRIKTPIERLKPIKVGESHNLQVGQMTLAIGNPFGFDQTLTTGIVSALGREIESITRRPIQGVIQTNAAINPGNSGGPLLDSAGRLIGVNTAIYSPTGSYAGIGFAVPVDTVNRIVPQLIAHGKVTKPGLGIEMADEVTVRRLLGKTGVLVYNVVEGGGADKAGIMPIRRDRFGRLQYDLIVEIEGKSIENSVDLYRVLDTRAVGDIVKVVVERGGSKKSFEVTLGAIR